MGIHFTVQATLVYPHQLFDPHPAITNDAVVVLAEDPLFFSQFRFHRQKLMLHRASMKRYEHELRLKNRNVRYVEAAQLSRTEDVAKVLADMEIKHIRVVDPSDDWLLRRLKAGLKMRDIELTAIPDPHFLTSQEEIDRVVEGKKSLYFTSFYIAQRKRLGILVDDDQRPFGGKWSFDQQNRKKLPKGMAIPPLRGAGEDEFTREARAYVRRAFPKAPGSDSKLIYPTNHAAAKKWLNDFLDDRFPFFGDYEDAISTEHPHLFHSVLTPCLNIGLLSPQQVINAAVDRIDSVPLNALEGFVRQVIGWREYVRAVYLVLGCSQRTSNFFDHSRPLPKSFYEGNTGIPPLDLVLRRVLDGSYCHHIERLMVLGNFMLLCEIKPDHVYQWFMEMFIDAYDWVMVPNVYGMSQFSDGGKITTKPYLSGSNYLLKMSDFKKGDWQAIWDGLFWRFIHTHREFFASNPRMNMMTKQLDRMGAKLSQHLRNAETFLQTL